MKILHAFNRYLSITANWAYNLIDALPDSEIHIYANKYLKQNTYNPEWKYLELDFKSFKSFYPLFKEGIKDLPYKIVFKGLINKVGDKCQQLFNEYVTNNNIEIIHSHFGPFACEMSEKIKKLPVRHVVSFYGYDYGQLLYIRPQYLKLYKDLFKEADLFICEGNHGALTLEKLGCPGDKIQVVHLGIDIKKIPDMDRIKKMNSLNLVQIASMTEKKGHFYTIRAFQEALQSCPDMQLTFVGSPKKAEDIGILNDIKEIIVKHDLENHVKIIDRIELNRLYGFLNSFDVFIHPSCVAQDKDSEGGAPVVLLEAQAMGLPIISTLHCDIPDEVVHNETGFLGREKDISQLATYISEFYTMTPERYTEFSNAAKQHIKKHYDIEKSGQKLYQLYSQLLPEIT